MECYFKPYFLEAIKLSHFFLLLSNYLHLISKARVFYFSFYRPSRPNFLKNENKNDKRDFFQFYFCISLRLMPVQYLSLIMFFHFVFSTAARLVKLPSVTAPGEILPF